ncbi:MAG TPA: biotin--[acetyl-CoA-carboxylase] ligase [Phycisphaerales bacterium]|nr:biotin--[acetyl-CoA-carboxylase] ligase [Phycisphaerales bacterium]
MSPATSPQEPLDPDRIAAGLSTRRIGRKGVVFAETASTNDLATRYATDPANDGLAVFAEHQTAGRGRAGAAWHSDPGKSLLCSVLLLGSPCPGELLSLAAAVAVAETLNDDLRVRARIKWPNDILINGKKVAGILLETRGAARRVAHIIGIGVNCLQSAEDFPPELRVSATSLAIEAGAICDRTAVARRLLTSLDRWVETAAASPAAVTDAWRQYATQLHQRITVIYDGRRFSGHCIDVDPEKGLVLRLDTGGIRMFDAAHTSIDKKS